MVTRYDKEVFDLFNWSALATLFFSLFCVKILTTSLIQGRYIESKFETKSYFISLAVIMTANFVYIFNKKKQTDHILDMKYTPIVLTMENNKYKSRIN